MIQAHEKREERSGYAVWQIRGKPRGVMDSLTCRYDPVDEVIHLESNFLPIRKQNAEYLIGLLQRLVTAAKQDHLWEDKLVFADNTVSDREDLEKLTKEKQEKYKS